MTLIGFVSDTHDNIDAVRRAARLFVSKGVSLVIHLGDIVAPFTLKAFKSEGVERLIAVYGNNCGEKLGLQATASQLGYEIDYWPHKVEVGGKRILLIHGFGPEEKTVELIEALAASGRYDVVAYGHTHKVDVRRVGRTLILNPGEACGCLTGRRTVALLDTETMTVEIVEL
jgi:putative phosphoesterase